MHNANCCQAAGLFSGSLLSSLLPSLTHLLLPLSFCCLFFPSQIIFTPLSFICHSSPRPSALYFSPSSLPLSLFLFTCISSFLLLFVIPLICSHLFSLSLPFSPSFSIHHICSAPPCVLPVIALPPPVIMFPLSYCHSYPLTPLPSPDSTSNQFIISASHIAPTCAFSVFSFYL